MSTAKYLTEFVVNPETRQNIAELCRLKNTGKKRCFQNTESVIAEAVKRELEIERARHKHLESNTNTIKNSAISGWHP